MEYHDWLGNTGHIHISKVNNKVVMNVDGEEVPLSSKEVDQLIKLLKEAKVRGN